MKFEIRIYAYVDGTFAKVIEVTNETNEIVSFDEIVKTREEVAEEHKYLTDMGMKAETEMVMGKKVLYRTTYAA